jgi:ribosomal protein L37E
MTESLQGVSAMSGGNEPNRMICREEGPAGRNKRLGRAASGRFGGGVRDRSFYWQPAENKRIWWFGNEYE